MPCDHHFLSPLDLPEKAREVGLGLMDVVRSRISTLPEFLS